MVGNKSDLENKIDQEKVEKISREFNAPEYVVSAKDG